MRKIPTLFVREESRRFVTEEYAVELTDDAVATVKYDGTCVMFDGTEWWARREVKPGTTAPENFVAVEHDSTTGKTVGWIPMAESDWLPLVKEVVDRGDAYDKGTYELLGPKVNGNPCGFARHMLYQHGYDTLSGFPTSPPRAVFDAVRGLDDAAEGVVWWSDGRPLAKLKKRDIPRETGGEG